MIERTIKHQIVSPLKLLLAKSVSLLPEEAAVAVKKLTQKCQALALMKQTGADHGTVLQYIHSTSQVGEVLRAVVNQLTQQVEQKVRGQLQIQALQISGVDQSKDGDTVQVSMASAPEQKHYQLSLRELAKNNFKRDPAKEKQVAQFLGQLRQNKQKHRREVIEHSIRINQARMALQQQEKMQREELRARHRKELQLQHQKNSCKRREAEQKRVQLNEEFRKQLAELKSRTPLHVKLEDERIKKVLSQEEEIRLKLEESRQLAKISKDEIDFHEKTYLDAKRLRLKASQQSRRLSDISVPVSFKGRYYELAVKESHQVGPDQKSEIAARRSKLKKLQQEIKESYFPKADPGKHHQLLQLMERGRSSAAQPEKGQYELGIQYLQEVRSLPKRRVFSSNAKEETKPEEKAKDYLAQQREMRKERSQSDWRVRLPSSLPEEERKRRVFESVARIREKSRRIQEMLRVGGGPRARYREQLDRLYLEEVQLQMSLIERAKPESSSSQNLQ